MQLSLLHKFHDNTCSLIRFTLYGYLRIMYFRNMFYYGKSKAGSACFAGPAFVVCHARHTTEAPLSGQDSGAFSLLLMMPDFRLRLRRTARSHL